MITLELKEEISENISSIQDVAILEQIKQFLNIEKKENNDVTVFTPEQQKRIDISMRQYENGEYISDEEAEKDLNKWFEEEEKLLILQHH